MGVVDAATESDSTAAIYIFGLRIDLTCGVFTSSVSLIKNKTHTVFNIRTKSAENKSPLDQYLSFVERSQT
ncbi:hypothetical protein BDW69DRAFT_112069 [Aspergillus filifer]